jgi:HK97 family phage prohead protease
MKAKRHNLSFKGLELRALESGGKRCIEGIIPYNRKSVPIWGMTEIIGETAFNKTLADKSEVRALWNHNDSYVLGSTKAETLTLEHTAQGLVCRCILPDTTYASDLFAVVSRGDVRTMSFGFIPVKWTDENHTRTLKEVILDEVSYGVTYAAYPDTYSETFLRSYMNRRNIDIDSIEELLEKETLTKEEVTQLRKLAKSLNEVIAEHEPEAAGGEQARNATPGTAGTSTAGETLNGDQEKPKEDMELLQLAVEMELDDQGGTETEGSPEKNT